MTQGPRFCTGCGYDFDEDRCVEVTQGLCRDCLEERAVEEWHEFTAGEEPQEQPQ
jgi:NMD protein affecting ribosome stability and mRNA decay